MSSALNAGPTALTDAIASALNRVPRLTSVIETEKPFDLPSWFDVTGLAVASIGAACAELADLAADTDANKLTVDQQLASSWFDMTIRPIGWALPPPWDAIAGNYETKDGWILLHTNAPLHRRAALSVLQTDAKRSDVASAVATWHGNELESAIVAAGGCAARMRSLAAWRDHAQGRAVANEPLIHWTESTPVKAPAAHSANSRSLAGVRVLDLTRILAGPVATRFLAGFGADVLRLDPPNWDEPTLAPEVTLGKRCAELDLASQDGQRIFKALLSDADILVHGLRPGALDALGFDEGVRRAINPALIDVSLCAYGWTGPWQARRGFDSLVQMSSGIAEIGTRSASRHQPTPLPVQALDHATGYLVAAAALHALRARRHNGTVLSAKLSLARTAMLLASTERAQCSEAPSSDASVALAAAVEDTEWGRAQRVAFPVTGFQHEPHWVLPPCSLKSGRPVWS